MYLKDILDTNDASLWGGIFLAGKIFGNQDKDNIVLTQDVLSLEWMLKNDDNLIKFEWQTVTLIIAKPMSVEGLMCYLQPKVI